MQLCGPPGILLWSFVTIVGALLLKRRPDLCDYVLCSREMQERLLPALQSAITRFYGDSPLWNGLNGLLPYILPLLGLLLGLLILLSLGPILFNKIMAFLKQQLNAIKMQPIQVHYHRLDMAD